MIESFGYAALEARALLTPFEFARRDPGTGDVVLDLEFCGICHSDLHYVKQRLGYSFYPSYPGTRSSGGSARLAAR